MKNSAAIWIIVIVVILALCCCAVLAVGVLVWRGSDWGNISSLAGRVEATAQFDRTLDVRAPASLDLDVPVGDITVRTGTGSQIVISATKHAWGNTRARAQEILDGIAISAVPAGNQVQVRVTGLTDIGSVPRSPQVELVITVPQETAVTVNSRVGRVRVNGTHGDLSITADVGEVILSDVIPSEKMSIQTRVATIEVSGALAPEATYEITSDIGRIALRVPAESAFNLDARSDIGNVSLGFTVVGQDSLKGVVGRQVRGQVGSNPSTSLNLRSRVGEVSIQPGR